MGKSKNIGDIKFDSSKGKWLIIVTEDGDTYTELIYCSSVEDYQNYLKSNENITEYYVYDEIGFKSRNEGFMGI